MKTPAQKNGLTPEVFSFCLLLACGFQIFELLLPKFPLFPWLRLGLSHIILLPFLLRFGVVPTLVLFLFRNWTAFIYGAQPITSFFISSTAGGFSLVFAGGIFRYLYLRRWVGLIGISVLLAISFNILQLYVVNLFIIQHAGFYFQLGPILIWSTVSGIIVAVIIHKIHNELEVIFTPFSIKSNKSTNADTSSYGNIIEGKVYPTLIGVLLFTLIFSINNLYFQCFLSLLGLLILRKGAVTLCLRAWPFFFYLAWLHLLYSEGTFIFQNWITREGLRAFILYAAKLANMLMTGLWLSKHLAHIRLSKNASFYLKGFLMTLPALSNIFPLSLELGKTFLKTLFKKESWSSSTEKILVRYKSELLNAQHTINESESP